MIPGSVTTARFQNMLKRMFQLRGGEQDQQVPSEILPVAPVSNCEREYDVLKGVLRIHGQGRVQAVAGESSIGHVRNVSTDFLAILRYVNVYTSVAGFLRFNAVMATNSLSPPLGAMNISPVDLRRRAINIAGNQVPQLDGQLATDPALAAPWSTATLERSYYDPAAPTMLCSDWYVVPPGGQIYCYAETQNVDLYTAVEGYVRQVDFQELLG